MTSRTDAGDAWPERAERNTLFRGKGVMRARSRDFDWSSTSLGNVVQSYDGAYGVGQPSADAAALGT